MKQLFTTIFTSKTGKKTFFEVILLWKIWVFWLLQLVENLNLIHLNTRFVFKWIEKLILKQFLNQILFLFARLAILVLSEKTRWPMSLFEILIK